METGKNYHGEWGKLLWRLGGGGGGGLLWRLRGTTVETGGNYCGDRGNYCGDWGETIVETGGGGGGGGNIMDIGGGGGGGGRIPQCCEYQRRGVYACGVEGWGGGGGLGYHLTAVKASEMEGDSQVVR